MGYPVELVMAANVSRERKRVLAAFGAKVIYSDPLEGIGRCNHAVPQDHP